MPFTSLANLGGEMDDDDDEDDEEKINIVKNDGQSFSASQYHAKLAFGLRTFAILQNNVGRQNQELFV